MQINFPTVMRRLIVTGAVLFLAAAQVAQAQTAVANPPATGVTLTASLPSPQPVGTPVTFTATASGSAGYQYQFWVRNIDVATSTYALVQDWSSVASWSLPTTYGQGTYRVWVNVKTGPGAIADVSNAMSFIVRSGAATGVIVSTNLPSPQPSGAAVVFTAAGQGGSGGYQYQFWMRNLDVTTSVYALQQDWSATATWSLPPNLVPGLYRIWVNVRSGTLGNAEASSAMNFVVRTALATGVALNWSVPSPRVAGSIVTLTAAGQGSGNYQYRFWIRSLDIPGSVYAVAQDWSATATFVLPLTLSPATYRVWVDVRAGAVTTVDASNAINFTLVAPPATAVTLTPGAATPQVTGTAVTFSAAGAGGTGTYQYRFWLRDVVTGVPTLVQDYGIGSSWTLPATTAPGTYAVIADVRTSPAVSFDARTEVAYTITAPPPPSITSLSVAAGTTAGGDTVTITGTNFDPAATVEFGALNPATVVSSTATAITVTTPAHAPGLVDVIVTNPGALVAVSPAAFSYVTPAVPGPTVSAITPATDTTVGGATVQIVGANFDPAVKVTLGGTAANVFVATATILRIIVPAHAAGVVDVTVTNPTGPATVVAGGFTYTPAPAAAPPPVISSLSTASAPLVGGPLTISGSGFAFGVKVLFGGVAGTVTSFTSTLINVAVPASAVGGPVDLTVLNLDGQSATLTKGFSYVAPAPSISTLNIHGSPMPGGTILLVAGTNFQPGATVTFSAPGWIAAGLAPSYDPVNKVIQVTTPPGPGGTPGPTGALEAFVDVTVTNPDGQSVGIGGFHYGPPPTASDFFIDTNAASKTLNNGKAGQLIDILGAEFSAQPGRGVQVLFSGPSAGFGTIDLVRSNATTITVGIPKLNPGNYQIVVTNFDGQFTRVPGTLIILGP